MGERRIPINVLPRCNPPFCPQIGQSSLHLGSEEGSKLSLPLVLLTALRNTLMQWNIGSQVTFNWFCTLLNALAVSMSTRELSELMLSCVIWWDLGAGWSHRRMWKYTTLTQFVTIAHNKQDPGETPSSKFTISVNILSVDIWHNVTKADINRANLPS